MAPSQSTLRFVAHMRVPRAGRLPDDFCLQYSPADAAAALGVAKAGHLLLEYLGDPRATVTKLYLDHETYFDHPPTQQEEADLLRAVRSRVGELCFILSSPYDTSREVTHVLATRHGFCATRGMHKLSFRPMLQGVRLLRGDIPAVLRAAGQLDDDFWDLSVYKGGEQLLAAIHGAKASDDTRVLRPESPDDDPLLYVAQHVDDAWPLMTVPQEVVAATTDSAAAGTSVVPPPAAVVPEHPSEDPAVVAAIVDCLAPATAADRAQWIRVGTALKRIGEHHYEDWLRFSRAATSVAPEKFGGEHDCRKTWDSLLPQGTEGGAFGRLSIGVGTLRYLARRDSPEAYSRIAATPRPPADAKISTFSLDMGRDLAQKLRAGFQSQLGGLPDDTEFTSTAEASITFRHAGVAGRVEKDYGVYMGDEFLGSLVPNVPVKGPMTALHKSIAPSMDFVYNRDAENTAHLRSVTPNTDTTVRLYNIRTDAGALAQIIARGNKDVTVNSQKSIDAARSIINTAVQHHGTTVLGDLNQIFIGTLNVYNNNVVVNSPDAGRRDDESLAMVVIDHNPEFRDRVKFVPEMKNACCNGLYFCDVDTNLWIQEANTFMERRVLGYIRSLPDSSVTTAELKHMRSRRGTSDTLYIMAREVADAGFKDRLDNNPHLFAMENCLLDTRTMTMRPFQPADYIGYTVGWSYDSDAARTHRPALERFLHQVLPVADERKVVLSFFAGSLSGVRQSKSFLALTDRRAGYNGKSALVNLMARFFGFYGEFNTRFVCAGSFQKDRDSHDAGLEPYRNTRLLVAEELKHNMSLDVALLKKLAGGSDVTVGGRRFGMGDRFNFVWRANIVLVFNEGDCPRFDGDAALLQRMLVAPMRSKFVAELPGDPEEYTFIADKTIAQKFPLWLPALLDVLKEHYDPDAMDSPPLSMRQWGQNVATEANPLGSWMEERVVVTGKKEDYVQLSDVIPLYRSDDQLRRRMDEDSFKRFAKAYLKTNGLTFKEKDNVLNGNGVRTTARHAARGIKMGTQL